jgi:hypothetical protein
MEAPLEIGSLQAQSSSRFLNALRLEFGAVDFASNFWNGPCYFDRDLGLFKAMGYPSSLFSLAIVCFSSQMLIRPRFLVLGMETYDEGRC